MSDALLRLRTTRAETLEALAGLDESALERPIPWRDRPSDVRAYLLRLADGDDRRRVLLEDIYAALGWRPSEAARLLGLALEAHGQLRAVLVGVSGDYLDRQPAPGEWSLRQVLAHVEQIAERYRLQAAYAVERVHSPEQLPVRIPEDRLPPVAPTAGNEAPAAVLDRMDGLYDRVMAGLAGLGDEDLAAPTIWAGWPVDVRFRLLRFAAHERQHAVQAVKTLTALGVRQSEAQLILGQAESARGALMGRLAGLPSELAQQAPGDRETGHALPSVAALLGQEADEERATVELVRQHVAGG